MLITFSIIWQLIKNNFDSERLSESKTYTQLD
uniref:Uncharacterized protein n=1 Tax=Gloeothece verrucosa (strain PCC 7822) TaxID=497965 RepID=E0UAU9_GLOV7|nr:hypothetical protein Cyan7822_3116 [Gloeothece verrucosa PCC 7822]